MPRLADAATLCTSELAPSIYRHAPGLGSLLRLAVELAEVRVTVYDGTLEPPVIRPYSLGRGCGWGLRLVAEPADDRGTSRGAPLGLGGAECKGVWFTLGT
ncbi:ATP-binding protein [Streptomyces pactum]|uniref:ATP-binding protein n=1 Tax=Streptomyces pactum TaxID=68249 RepID=A0ABS0NML3_9ACTN|nr:ATP-binding protein [Streptomyces pactum]MBH5336428.1 ATP-binding protein [Streptomyces pactum]